MSSAKRPITVATCHCSDCRRLSGAPVNSFAAFESADPVFEPKLGPGTSHTPGVRRWFCNSCGTPLAATYDYLPGQIYVPVGLFDQIDTLTPESQSHTASRVVWLPLDESCPQNPGSGRKRLNQANGRRDN